MLCRLSYWIGYENKKVPAGDRVIPQELGWDGGGRTHNAGVKVPCLNRLATSHRKGPRRINKSQTGRLTADLTFLLPGSIVLRQLDNPQAEKLSGVGSRSRTDGLQSHNLAL